ncbi:hypothetical protein EUGRSUZ_G02547, partial [Eucalyptus grandis]
GSLPSHGAEQFDDTTPQGRKQRSTFFNYFVFCLSCGGLIAVTLVVLVEDNKGWQWGFGISTLAIFLSIPIFLAGSAIYRNKIPSGSRSRPFSSLSFLNRAVTSKPINRSLECSVQQVEDVKVVLKLLPVFACTIILNCCLAQLSTFSVQQTSTMDTKLGSLEVPPASLPIFPILFIMILAPVYDHFIIPFARLATKTETGITHLQRIDHGATDSGLLASPSPLLITFFWIALQYLFLRSADLFTLAGLPEFFFSEAPASTRSLATALSWASLAMGYYLSTVIVPIVNTATGHSGHRPWLEGASLNAYHLERFYWLMCVLSGLNFLNYLFWASKYKYRSAGSSK